MTSSDRSGGLAPTGTLVHLNPDEVLPNPENPRILFDPEPLQDLLDNIRTHGVLVPVTVYRIRGQDKYSLLDGARRHKCCQTLAAEGHSIRLPANVVEPPDRLAALLAMFSIHNLREQWELMPTALSLRHIMDELGEADSRKLANLTGMSEPQVERCKVLLSVPEEFQRLSLLTDPSARIPANLWIEGTPVLAIWREQQEERNIPFKTHDFYQTIADKYRAGSIKSVIHFRRIVEAFERTEDHEERRADVIKALDQYMENVEAETRQLFDPFVADERRVDSVLSACDVFTRALRRHRVGLLVDRREEIERALRDVRTEINAALTALEGRDAPRSSATKR